MDLSYVMVGDPPNVVIVTAEPDTIPVEFPYSKRSDVYAYWLTEELMRETETH